MKKILLFLAYGLVFTCLGVNAQITVSTNHTGNNASDGVTFNFYNSNANGILLQAVEGQCNGTGTYTFELWMHPDPVAGSPGAISAANGWTMIGTSSTAVAAASTTQVMISGMNQMIASGDTVGMYFRVVGNSVRYMTLSGSTINTFTNGGCSILTGGNMSWGGSITGPSFNPRGFVGGLTFIPATPCSGAPNAGTVQADSTSCAASNVLISTVGATLGTGLNFYWFAGTSVSGPFSLIDSGMSIIDNPTVSTYYYCQAVCGADTSYSDTAMVNIPNLFPAGTYTIDQTAAASATNFTSITDAVAAISCGTTGPVVFNVVAGTGPYVEQVTLPEVATNSATNTITFNGNGESLAPTTLSTSSPGAITISGDYFIIDSFTIAPLGTAAWGIHFLDDPDNNIIRNNTINISTASTSTNYNGIVFSQTTSLYTPTFADSNLIENNTINGGYYCIRIYGQTANPVYGNKIVGNTVNDYYYYGIYNYASREAQILDNVVGRPTRTTVSTSYGLYNSYCGGSLIDGNHVQDCFAAAPTASGSNYGCYIYQYGDSVTTVVSNNIVDLHSGGGSSYGVYVSGEEIQILHNTINVGTATGTNSSSKYGLYYSGTSAVNPVVSNNIFYVSAPSASSGTKYGIYQSSTGSVLDGGNNWFYMDPSNSTNAFRYNGTNYSTLAAYQTASSTQSGSIETNPMYTNAPTDYTPMNYTYDNYGLAVGVTEDFNNVARGAVPDVGAIEFSAPPCTAPPTAGTPEVSDTIVCAGFNVNFGLSGNSFGTGQSYTWQWSSTMGGTYTDLDTAQVSPAGTYTVDSTGYYRCMVICGTDTAYSTDVFIQTNPALAGGTYTIDQNSTTADFASFSAAAAALECGITGPVVFNVTAGSGPYIEQVFIPEVVGASATNTITFNCNGETLQYDSASSGNLAVLTLGGTDYTTVDSLIITSMGTQAAGIVLTNSADYNTISNSTVIVDSTSTSSSLFGIALTGSAGSATVSGNNGNYNTFENNTVIGGYFGISCYGAGTTAPAVGNKFINNDIREFYYYAMRTYYTENTEVVGNSVSSPARTNGSYKYCFYNYYAVGGLKLANNSVHNIYDNNTSATGYIYAYYISASDAPASNPNKLYNNEMYYIIHNGGGYGLYNYSCDNTLFYHNSIMFDNQLSSATSGLVRGVYVNGTPTGAEVKNNLIVLSETGTHQKQGLVYYSNPDASDYNDVFIPATATSAYYGYSGSALATLAAFQAATGTDTFSLNVDPMTPPLTTDPTPLNTLMNNLGTPVGISTDHIGNFRSATTPDIGSREFPVCYPSVTTITSSSPTNMACIGDTVTLTAPTGATSYQWQLNGSDIPGATAIDYIATGSGDYTVIIDSAGCIGSQAAPTSVTINPLPMVNAGSDASYCDMSSVTLSGMGADTYTWDNGVVDGVAFNISTSGAYTVTGTDSTTGCMNTDTVMLTVLPLPLADAGADQLVCDGATVTLTGTGGDSLYWDNGVVDGVAFTPTATGSYILTTMNDSTGCMAMDTVLVTVNTSPTLTTINPTATGGLSFNFTSDASGANTYLWDFGDGNTDNAASPTHTYTTTGMTTVTLTVTNDCGSKTITIEVPVGIANIDVAGIRVYPNPTKGQVTIESAANYSLVGVRLLNVLGAEIEVGANINSNRAELNMSALSAGMYTLLINTDKGTYQQVINLVD